MKPSWLDADVVIVITFAVAVDVVLVVVLAVAASGMQRGQHVRFGNAAWRQWWIRRFFYIVHICKPLVQLDRQKRL